mmetsp:Transcript_30802/g.49833  ORF Transcript_30802/g.49833 Transcript_30802/m.49833 type:complete len:129 (+) Transcript_30802:464-850(+)
MTTFYGILGKPLSPPDGDREHGTIPILESHVPFHTPTTPFLQTKMSGLPVEHCRSLLDATPLQQPQGTFLQVIFHTDLLVDRLDNCRDLFHVHPVSQSIRDLGLIYTSTIPSYVMNMKSYLVSSHRSS